MGVQIIRIVVCWALYKDPPILGNYHKDPGLCSCCLLEVLCFGGSPSEPVYYQLLRP